VRLEGNSGVGRFACQMERRWPRRRPHDGCRARGSRQGNAGPGVPARLPRRSIRAVIPASDELAGEPCEARIEARAPVASGVKSFIFRPFRPQPGETAELGGITVERVTGRLALKEEAHPVDNPCQEATC
jgi:hypothetical protein